ncbi:hypothetical protein Tco_1030313 [Tanacetum coccineum]|uniref:Uncharacterized protein n=1 Tax=Tanacetum coccineum TaxID=301880 RepID=A0ABQ5G5V6_9ASTR
MFPGRIWLALKIKFEGLTASNTPCRSSAIRPRDQNDPHDDAHHEGKNSAVCVSKTSKHGLSFWENLICRKEILTSPFPQKPTPVVQSCQRDHKALASVLAFVCPRKKFVYLMKGNLDQNKCVKKFNSYARYSVEHWKNPHAKIFYIKRQKEPGKPKEEVYPNSKNFQVIKTTGELGHEHKFVTEIIVRRANGVFSSITS